MSKNRSVSLTEVEEMKAMVVAGTQPQKIANHFGISVSTVHNYKNQFKNEGLEFASVRGRQATTPRQPSGEVNHNGNSRNQNHQLLNNNQVNGRNSSGANAQLSNETNVQAGSTFVINGTTFNITGKAKSVDLNTSVKGVTFYIEI